MSTNRSFCVNTWLWTSPFTTDTVKLFPKIKEMGFDMVEIPVEYPELIDAQVLEKALADYELKGIVCAAFGPSRDLTHEDPKVHQQCFDYIQACFDLCNQWGSKFLAGPMYSATGKARMLPPKERKQEWDLAVTNLQKVCEMASKQGLSIAIEPLNRFETDMVNNAEDMMRMIKAIDHPAARVMMDSFHMTIEEIDLEKAFLSVGEKLIHVQVSENNRGVPGSGLTDWMAFKSGLDKINYQGAISIESFTPEIKELAGAVCIWKKLADNQDDFAVKGLAFLRQLLA